MALAALSVTLSVQFGSTGCDRFDERLAETARAAASMVDRTAAPRGSPRTRSPPSTSPAGAPSSSSGRRTARRWGGSRRGTPAAGPAPGAPPVLERVTLPDGRSARLYRAWLRPHPPTAGPVAVALARDVDQLEARLTRFRTLLWGSTLAVVILAAAVVSLVVRGSLRHLARLSASIAAMDASSLGPGLELQDCRTSSGRPS